jgi:hypothetical protein
MECSHTILLSFRKKLIWVPGSQEREPGTRNMMRTPVPENPEPAVGSRSRKPGTHMRSGFLGTEPETDTLSFKFHTYSDRTRQAEYFL